MKFVVTLESQMIRSWIDRAQKWARIRVKTVVMIRKERLELALFISCDISNNGDNERWLASFLLRDDCLSSGFSSIFMLLHRSESPVGDSSKKCVFRGDECTVYGDFREPDPFLTSDMQTRNFRLPIARALSSCLTSQTACSYEKADNECTLHQ